jgi:hypothetical protein
MKKHFQQSIAKRSVRLFISVLALAAAIGVSDLTAAGYPDTNPDGSINTGNASIFSVLTHGDLNMSGSSSITGNAGVGDSGNANLSGSAHVNGNLTINNKGKYSHSGSSGVTGTVTTNQTSLDNGWADALSLSAAANMESVSPQYASLTNVNLNNGGQMTIMGGPNQKIVLTLQNFMLDNSSTFTLQGTATTTFIINVAKNFSLDHASQISLLGVPPKNVLFNLAGDGKLNHGSQGSGILLAVNGKVSLAGNTGGTNPVGSQWTGRVIARQVELSDSSKVVTPVTNP